MGLTSEQVGLFMGSCILAGLLVQWPLGWLSDRRDRIWLIGRCACASGACHAALAVLPEAPVWLLFAAGFAVCAPQFCLYPLAVALANEPRRCRAAGLASRRCCC